MKREATLMISIAVLRDFNLLSEQQVLSLGAFFTSGTALMEAAMRDVIKSRLNDNSNQKEPYLEGPFKIATKLMKIWKEAANEIQSNIELDGSGMNSIAKIHIILLHKVLHSYFLLGIKEDFEFLLGLESPFSRELNNLIRIEDGVPRIPNKASAKIHRRSIPSESILLSKFFGNVRGHYAQFRSYIKFFYQPSPAECNATKEQAWKNPTA